MAEKVLNLIPADLDRAIRHIKPNIDCPNLDQLIAECIDNVVVLEREVRDRQGRWFSLRIRPYKDIDNRIDGAVLALFDADVPKRSEERARAAIELVRAVVERKPEPVAIADGDRRIIVSNRAFSDVLSRLAGDAATPKLDQLPAEWAQTLQDLIKAPPGTISQVSVPTRVGAAGEVFDAGALTS